MKIPLNLGFALLVSASLLVADSFSANQEPDTASLTRSSSAQSPSPSNVSADYVLAPSDLIEVIIYGEPDLTRDVRISRDDTIVLPLIGQINLTSKTLRQAEDTIRDLYGSDYLVNPQVNLMVKEYSKRSVNVLGAVAHPGPVLFPLEQGLTLVDAIAAAGGMTEIAQPKDVKITRTLSNGETKIIDVNFDTLISGKSSDKVDQKKDVPLMINDIINVGEIFLLK
jgi:polysaccharide export outer membrane protein